ncbi:MAG: capsule assembly Wzi family protein, partial [Gammaproteobacteria bacterium]|nr:capsule assembly Wzi family protein [Gammaproteobacteria bacterium]
MLTGTAVAAGPWFNAGDERLRSDIQLLADAGVVKGPVSTWPLSWEDIVYDADAVAELRPWQSAALARVKAAAETARGGFDADYTAHASVANNPVQFRGFSDTPREDAEIGGGIAYASERVAINLQVGWASDPVDDKEARIDGSYATVALGNWLLSASAQERWWGPGWSNSLIYSSNARPVPSISFDRNLTTPFSSRWLSWLGNWDLSMQVGHLENDRAIPEALLYTLRVTARPTRGLEVGISRSAQLCGETRTCGLKTWGRMLLGKDNRDDNVSRRDEPGNQLGGWDIRWSDNVAGIPYA